MCAIQRVGLEHHREVARLGGNVIDDLPVDDTVPEVIGSSPRYAQHVDLPQPDGPEAP